MVRGTVRKRERMVRIEIAMSACVAWRLGAERYLIGGQCCRKTKQSRTRTLNTMYAARPHSKELTSWRALAC